MPTVSLPADNRWGSIGQSLGGLAGQIAGAAQQKAVDTGVAEVIQDPQVPTKQKLSVVMQKYGTPGVTSFTNQLKAQLVQSQIGQLGASSGLIAADTTGKNQTNAIQAATMPDALLAPGLANAATRARTSLTSNTADQVKELLPSTVAESQNKAALTGGQSQAQDLANQQAQMQAAFTQSLLTGGTDSLKKTLSDNGITDPTEQSQVITAFQVGGQKGMMTKMNEIQQNAARVKATTEAANIRNQEPKPTPNEPMKLASDSQALSTSTENFLDALTKNGGGTGTLSGATLESFAASHGFPVKDTEFLKMYESQKQAILDRATTGGGFVSGARINLAKDVGLKLNNEPILNFIAADAAASQKLSELQSQKSAYSTTPNINMKPLDDAIDHWQKIQAKYSVTSYISKDGHSVVSIGPNVVNPETLKPLVEADKSYQGTNQTWSGRVIAQAAKTNGLTIAQQAAALGVKLGQ